jgi:hypothetical protein
MVARLYEEGPCVEKSHEDAVRWAGSAEKLEAYMAMITQNGEESDAEEASDFRA